jgi:hypothetical protein
MRVVRVDFAHEWRGSQSQVLLTAQEMSRRGHEVTVACRTGGGLAARARAAGRAGRKRFERHFTAARMVDETLRVYEELTASRPAMRAVYGFSERDADAA